MILGKKSLLCRHSAHCSVVVLAMLLLGCGVMANVASTDTARLNQEVQSLYDAGRYNEAMPLADHTLRIREKTLGPDHPDVAASLNNLALLYRTKGDYAQAEALHQRALRIREKTLGPDHPDVAASLNNLALLYRTKGDYAQAEPLYQRA